MSFLDNAEVSLDSSFLDILISPAKWEVEHLNRIS